MPRIPERIHQYQNGYSAGYQAAAKKSKARIVELESQCEFYKRFLIKAVDDLHDANRCAPRAEGGTG